MIAPRLICSLCFGVWAFGSTHFAHAADRPAVGQPWRYQLIRESTYLDDCPPCGRPSFWQPLRGSFFLTPGTSDPLFDRYDLTEVQLTVGGEGEGSIRLTGTGQLEVGGEVALVHRLSLRLTIRAPGRPEETVNFESPFRPGEPAWPRLAIAVEEVNPSPFRVLHLNLESMPIRDLWFSTAHGFTAGLPGPKPIPRSAADVLSDQGRVTVSREEIAQTLALPLPLGDLNVDALEVAPGGEVQLSFTSDFTSSILGNRQHGDLVGIPARLVKPQAEFANAIGAQPGSADHGLDAVQQQSDGSWWFSLRDSVFSEKLGFLVGRGDLMSTGGQRIRSNRDLLKAFPLVNRDRDYGLDAVFVWPSGEIWFSTEDSVELSGFGFLLDGDLLSDRGQVIFGNLELLQPFSPLEDALNFGLDGLVIATDATTPAPELPRLTLTLEAETVVLHWTGLGRFYQVEKATGLDGRFEPLSPVTVEHTLRRPTAVGPEFYQVRQW